MGSAQSSTTIFLHLDRRQPTRPGFTPRTTPAAGALAPETAKPSAGDVHAETYASTSGLEARAANNTSGVISTSYGPATHFVPTPRQGTATGMTFHALSTSYSGGSAPMAQPGVVTSTKAYFFPPWGNFRPVTGKPTPSAA